MIEFMSPPSYGYKYWNNNLDECVKINDRTFKSPKLNTFVYRNIPFVIKSSPRYFKFEATIVVPEDKRFIRRT